MQRPIGVTIIAILFCAAGVYLWILGATLLISPGTWPLTAGRRFMYGLELAGSYMSLLFGTGYALIGCARWAAMAVMVISVYSLVPSISMAELGLPVFWYGLQIALRVAVGWYLAQAPAVVDVFAGKH